MAAPVLEQAALSLELQTETIPEASLEVTEKMEAMAVLQPEQIHGTMLEPLGKAKAQQQELLVILTVQYTVQPETQYLYQTAETAEKGELMAVAQQE